MKGAADVNNRYKQHAERLGKSRVSIPACGCFAYLLGFSLFEVISKSRNFQEQRIFFVKIDPPVDTIPHLPPPAVHISVCKSHDDWGVAKPSPTSRAVDLFLCC